MKGAGRSSIRSGPSLHDGSKSPAALVCAGAGTGRSGPDNAGSSASIEKQKATINIRRKVRSVCPHTQMISMPPRLRIVTVCGRLTTGVRPVVTFVQRRLFARVTHILHIFDLLHDLIEIVARRIL